MVVNKLIYKQKVGIPPIIETGVVYNASERTKNGITYFRIYSIDATEYLQTDLVIPDELTINDVTHPVIFDIGLFKDGSFILSGTITDVWINFDYDFVGAYEDTGSTHFNFSQTLNLHLYKAPFQTTRTLGGVVYYNNLYCNIFNRVGSSLEFPINYRIDYSLTTSLSNVGCQLFGSEASRFVNLPYFNSATFIGAKVFWGSTLNYDFSNDTILSIYENAFVNCKGKGLKFQNCTTIGNACFVNSDFEKIELPNLQTMSGTNHFLVESSKFSNLKYLDLGMVTSIPTAFSSHSYLPLEKLILRNPTTVCSIPDVTNIKDICVLYVPDNMVLSYMDDDTWSQMTNIHPLSELPIE